MFLAAFLDCLFKIDSKMLILYLEGLFLPAPAGFANNNIPVNYNFLRFYISVFNNIN